jgi:beta-glucanase (GH16 family)
MIRPATALLVALALFALGASVVGPASAAARDDGASCGRTIPKRSGGYWRCTFADRFSGESLDPSKWVAQRTDTSGYTNGQTSCFLASPNNISVSGGTLKLTSRKEAEPFTCKDPHGDFTTEYTSGMVSTWGRFSQAYGRFKFRARITSARTKGLHSALWLWPADRNKYGAYPGSGEIDIAEMYSAYPDRAIPYIHYNAALRTENVTNNFCMISDLSEFHNYTAIWTKRKIKIKYDREKCLVHKWSPADPLSGSQPFDQPFILALTQALGVGGNAFDPATTPLPATTEIDYVRVWR